VLGTDIAAAPRGFFPGLIWTAAEAFDAGGSTPAPPAQQQRSYTRTGCFKLFIFNSVYLVQYEFYNKYILHNHSSSSLFRFHFNANNSSQALYATY